MFHDALSHIAIESILSSEALLQGQLELFYDTSATCHITTQVRAEINARYGNQLRLQAVNTVTENLFFDNALPNFSVLDKYFEHFFCCYSTNIILNDKIYDEYSAICSKIHPYFIIAHHLAKEYDERTIDLSHLAQTAKYLSSLALQKDCSKHFAENHMHYGGAIEPISSIMYMMNKNIKKFIHDTKLEKPPLSFPNNKFSMKQLILICRAFSQALNNNFENVYHTEDVKQMIKDNYNSSPVTDNGLLDFSYFGSPLLEQSRFYYSTQQDTQAFLLYLVHLFSLYRCKQTNETTKRAIVIIINTINIIRSDMVMSRSTGLEKFVDYYSSSSRNIAADESKKIIAENVFLQGVTHLEYKQAHVPNNKNSKCDFINLSRGVARAITENHQHLFPLHRDVLSVGVVPYETSEMQFHSCLHFIKRYDKTNDDDPNSNICSYRHRNTRNDLMKKTEDLIKWLGSSNVSESLESIFGEHSLYCLNKHNDILKHTRIDFRHMLRALDAAGDENLTSPEVFAPYIRHIRSHKFHSDIHSLYPNVRALKPLTLSFHAGEDFAHIATGMRRVDETVKFMEYHHADRLGHALAIGINPKEWFEDKFEIVMKKEDRLDDLVWLWKCASDLGDPYAFKLQDEARDIGISIYGNHWNIYDAFDAWILRRNCPDKFFSSVDVFSHYKEMIPDKEKSTHDNSIKLFQQYHTDKCVRMKGNEPLFIKYSDADPAELLLLEKIQDCQITEYANIGIIIEVNLSSNLYIGRIKNIHSHPIFRWNPVNEQYLATGEKFNKFGIRNGVINVCINTDDPAIFPTTLQNEYNMLEAGATKAFNTDQVSINTWIDNLRNKGMEIFKKNHQSLFFND